MSDELKEMRIIKHGSSWMFTLPDFQDVQSSPYLWRNDIGKTESLDHIYELLCETRDRSPKWLKSSNLALIADKKRAEAMVERMILEGSSIVVDHNNYTREQDWEALVAECKGLQ